MQLGIEVTNNTCYSPRNIKSDSDEVIPIHLLSDISLDEYKKNEFYEEYMPSDISLDEYLKEGLSYSRCDCKNSFLQSKESGDRDQEPVKTKSYGACLFLNYLFSDFLQMHQEYLSKTFASPQSLTPPGTFDYF